YGICCFFFQAGVGIRDWSVTGVQTCALPIFLQVPGEEREHVYHRLYSPRKYRNENILVVGGGNSAVEAALTLSEQNTVCLSYREIGRASCRERGKIERYLLS